VKSLEDEYRNAARNAWTYGIWRNDRDIQRREEWHELRNIVTEIYPEVKTFPDLDKILTNGNVDSRLKSWMVDWYNRLKEDSDYLKQHPEYKYSDYNEIRAISMYYYKFLHPEEAERDRFIE
jgi:hypothetical protein